MSASFGLAESSTEIVTVCRHHRHAMQCALTSAASGSIRSPAYSPMIFCVSCCHLFFFAADERNHVALMSIDGTPG